MITEKTKTKILSIVSVFETSRLMPRYDALVVLNDGPGGRPQITYGKHQTTEHGNLSALVAMYITSYGRYARELKPYLAMIGKGVLLSGNHSFKHLLRTAAADPIMHEVQDRFFDRYYWNPALKFFLHNAFYLPLSLAVIYDSFIHSGGVPSWLRDDFKESVPSKGGDEKAWIIAYVEARDNWLEKHPNKILRNTDYRTDCWKDCISNDNWDLNKPVVCKFNQANPSDWITIP